MKLLDFAALCALVAAPTYAQRGGQANAGPPNPFAGNEQAIAEGRFVYGQRTAHAGMRPPPCAPALDAFSHPSSAPERAEFSCSAKAISTTTPVTARSS